MTEPTVDPVDALYQDDPADFVERRSALVKSLKSDGDPERAAAVAKLRKPPRTAAALGEFARSDPGAVQALLDAARTVADSLRTGGADLRAAQSEYSSVVSNLVERAADAGDITSEAMRDRMRSTLLAAGADPDGEVARLLSIGALRDDAAAPGFAFGVVGPLDETAGTASEVGQEEPARPTRRRLRSVRTGPSSRGSGDDDRQETSDDEGSDAEEAEEPDQAARLDDALSKRETLAAERAEAEREAAARRETMRRRRSLERDVARLERRATRLIEQANEAEARAAVARSSADEAVEELEAVRARLDDPS